MLTSTFSKTVFAAWPLVLLGASGCLPRKYNNSDTNNWENNQALKQSAQDAKDCFTSEEYSCQLHVPAEVPDKSFLCLATYLTLAPKVDFSQAGATVNNIDAYREDGTNSVRGQLLVGLGENTGLNKVLKKHFTYKLCADNKTYTYSAAALQNGYNATTHKGVASAILATADMSREAETNKEKLDAAVANPQNAAKGEFVINNLICIRNLADEPCKNAYPKYIPITKINGLIGIEPINNVLGSVSIPSKNITILPGLDPAQMADARIIGIENENYNDRMALIKNAKQSILISSWQIKQKNGDIAGPKLRDAIINSTAPQKMIIGDLSTSLGNPFFTQPDNTPGTIPGAIIWGYGINKSYTYHRKLTIIDGLTTIFGGKNYANEYMQQYNDVRNWRDTDIKIVDANAAKLASTLFYNDWNSNTPDQYHVPVQPFTQNCAPVFGSTCLKFITHDPARQAGHSNTSDAIYTATIQAINSAKESVDIENAYVVASYPLVYALRMAANRGVRIRILTNSDKSIDVPELGHVMNLNALAIVQNVKNVQVYLKQPWGTSTLHSKFMVIDKKVAFLGTYNLHPASRTTASEFMGVFEQVAGDAYGPALKLSRLFETDIKYTARLLDQKYQQEITDAFNNAPQQQKAGARSVLAIGYDIL